MVVNNYLLNSSFCPALVLADNELCLLLFSCFFFFFLQDAESDVEEHEKQLQELKNVAALYADEVTLGKPHKYM